MPDIIVISAYRRVSVGSIEEAQQPLHEGFTCAGLQRGVSETELRKTLTLTSLQLHRGQDEESVAYQERSAFISFSAPRLNYEVSSEVLQAEGLLNEGWNLALDASGHFVTEFASVENLAMAAAYGSPGDGALAALYVAQLAVLTSDPLRALGEPDVAIDTRFLSQADRGHVAARLADEHHDHEHEVTAQIHVPASRIQLVGVFREQVTLCDSRRLSVDRRVLGGAHAPDLLPCARRCARALPDVARVARRAGPCDECGGRSNLLLEGAAQQPDAGPAPDPAPDASGVPVTCTPDCAGKNFGSNDGCGGTCFVRCPTPAPPRGTAYLVGGLGSPGPFLKDMWSWGGAAWTQIPGATPDLPCFDEMAGLGGGLVFLDGPPGSTTWTWERAGWTALAAVSPPGREFGAMTTRGSSIVLFGGVLHSQQIVGDTWTWDVALWTQRDVTGPAPRQDAAMATLGGVAVLFGGWADAPTGPAASNGMFGDTWAWDGAAWTELDVAGPPARHHAAMAALGTTLVLFGGLDATDSALGDTWTWDGTAWTEHAGPGPSPRANLVMAGLADQVVLFGGSGPAGEYLDDTWTWDGTAWTQVTVQGPPGRNSAQMASLP